MILEASTDARIARSEFVVSEVWRQLVDGRYFDDLRFQAYAGGLFKPFKIGRTKSLTGESLIEVAFQTEMRGGGGTAARFDSGVPIRGAEFGGFIGVSTEVGDYLVASLGNGTEWRKEAVDGGVIDLFFEKVVIGPLAQ